MFVVQDNKMDLLIAPLDVDIHTPVLTHKPFTRIIERGMGEVIFDLGKFRFGERRIVQPRLVILFQNVFEICR